MSPILGLKNSPHKHISILGHETSSIFDSVLHANLNNVCSPNIKSFPEEFLNSFMTYYHGVLDFCESFKEPIPFLPLTLPSKIFVNKAFNRQFDILNSFRPQPPFIWKLIQELDSFPQTFQCPSNIPSTPPVLKAKRFLSDKLILSALIKIVGFLIYTVPQFYGKICVPLSGVIFTSKNNPTYQNSLFFHISNTHLTQITGINYASYKLQFTLCNNTEYNIY